MDSNGSATGVERPVWQAIGAAVQGTSHKKNGLPCQDFQDLRLLGDETLLIALADGAGTAELADQGARCAVEVALEVMAAAMEAKQPEEEDGWASLVLRAFHEAQVNLQRLAAEMDISLREMATTLTCVIASGDWLVTGQIGDGAVVARNPQGELFSVTQAQRGEYANETFFLTQEEALQELSISILKEPVDALAVMSDGLTRLALKIPAYEPHPPFFQPLFAFTSGAQSPAQAGQHLAAFLNSPRVCARTDDDKALILAVRSPDSATEQIQEEIGQQAPESPPPEAEESDEP